ncbi:unnamed protein product [Protopolystoma xenopodis]|uniref:N-terminal Ras-GEF domain-containing protein n=1 Tax=Protopolystoma xenopodis TaxID=117903 RepID=A0A3S5A4D1_9PLAT|nr:unnamed protein product [Protopolystoma xenopodis]
MPDYSSLASGPGSTSHHSPFVPLTCSSSFVTASNTSSAPSLSLVPPFPLIPTSYALSNVTTPHSTYQPTSGPSVTVNGISSPSQVSIMPAYLHGSVSAGNGVGLSADEDLADRSLQQLLLDEEDYEEDLLLALPLVAGPTSTSTPSSYGTLTGLKMDEFSSCDLPNEVNPNIDGSTVAPSDSIISPVSWSANFSSSGRCCCCNYGYYGSAATTTPVNTVSTCLPGADQVSSAILSAVSIRHSSSDSGNSLSPVSSVRSSQHSPSLSATGSSSMVLRGGGHSTSPTHFATYHRRGSQPATASGIRKALPLPLPLQLPSLIGSSSSSASNDFTHHVANGSGGACPGAANKSPTPLHSSTATITNSYNFPSTMHFCHTCHPCCSRPIHPHVLLQTGSNASSTIGSFLSPSANISSFPSAATLMSCSSCLPLSTFPHSRTPAHSFGTPLLSPSVIGGSCYPPQIQLATLIKLVERLTYPAYFDSSMVNSFLMSFRRFTSPEDLLDLLIERFHVPDPEFSPDEWRVDLARGRLEPPAHYMLKRFRTGYKRRVQARWADIIVSLFLFNYEGFSSLLTLCCVCMFSHSLSNVFYEIRLHFPFDP